MSETKNKRKTMGRGAPNDLTGFQRDVLVTIGRLNESGESPIGLDIKEILEMDYGGINHGRLYPNLNELVGAGLVEKRERNGRSYYYSLAPRGKSGLESYANWVGGAFSEEDLR
jgi:DNA-binding PadR family transcriptional regulator